MASNDMNSWDEDSDERLHWQRVFANFKVQPRPSLSRRILGQLPTGRRHQPMRWLAGAGLLLLLGTGLIYVVRLRERPVAGDGNAITVVRSTPDQRAAAGRIRPSAAPTDRLGPRGLSVIDPLVDKTVAQQRPPDHQRATSGMEALPGHRTSPEQLSVGQARLHYRAGASLRATPVPIDPSLSKPARSVGSPFPIVVSKPTSSIRQGQKSVPVAWSASDRHDRLPALHSPAKQPLNDALPVAWGLLKPLGFMPLANALNALPGQLPVVDLAAPAQAAVVRSRLRWFIEAVPQSSFQWMSTLPASTAYLSPVSAPAAFSPSTWGYQISGGIRYRRWQANLSMGQLRRWAYYTVNENRYRVAPSPTDPHQLVRETQGVTENVALPMIGAGLSQQRLLARGRYTAELGGQVSYLTTIDQALLGLWGGVGRRLILNQHTELQVGLTVGYGLNRLLSEQQHLLIHPLVVGVGLRVQPRLTQ